MLGAPRTNLLGLEPFQESRSVEGVIPHNALLSGCALPGPGDPRLIARGDPSFREIQNERILQELGTIISVRHSPAASGLVKVSFRARKGSQETHGGLGLGQMDQPPEVVRDGTSWQTSELTAVPKGEGRINAREMVSLLS